METLTRNTTTSEIDEGAENFPATSWMDGMSESNNYESRLWGLLEKESLVDLSQFHQRGLVDEVPLYSQDSDIGFLPAGKKEANEILLRFSLKLLQSVIAYEQHRTGYFAAITVWGFPDARLVPNLFVCCGAIGELKEKLLLKRVTTPFGKQIKKLVSRLELRDLFGVREDTSTVPGSTRVFIGLSRRRYPGFVTLGQFQAAARASK